MTDADKTDAAMTDAALTDAAMTDADAAQTLAQLRVLPLAVLRRRLLAAPTPPPLALLEALTRDPRRGAQALAHSLQSRLRREQAETQRLYRLWQFERELWAAGYELVAGVDEAGMAPLAGPVVAAAVILPRHYQLPGLNDSKKILAPARRAHMAAQLKQAALCWATGYAEVAEIDRLNIYHAGLLAMQRAVAGLVIKPDFVLVDARKIPVCPAPQRGIIRGDTLSASIAAASIIAKTTRDAHMTELDRQFPGYGLASHKGYPTPAHCRALCELGASPIHRRSFAPVRQVLGLAPVQTKLDAPPGAE